MPRSLLGHARRGDGWIGSKILSVLVIAECNLRHRLLLGLVLFRLCPPIQPWSGGSLSDMGCMFPQPFAAGENQSYSEFLGRNRRPAVPGVFYPDKFDSKHLEVGSFSLHPVTKQTCSK
jgi:hypothetical protein